MNLFDRLCIWTVGDKAEKLPEIVDLLPEFRPWVHPNALAGKKKKKIERVAAEIVDEFSHGWLWLGRRKKNGDAIVNICIVCISRKKNWKKKSEFYYIIWSGLSIWVYLLAFFNFFIFFFIIMIFDWHSGEQLNIWLSDCIPFLGGICGNGEMMNKFVWLMGYFS